MDKATALNATSADAAAFAAEVSASASIVSSTMFEATGIVIGDAEPAQGPGTVTMYYQMSVSDPTAYVAALKKMGTSVDTNGAVSALFAIPVDGDSGITHVSAISGSSMNEMMTRGVCSSVPFGKRSVFTNVWHDPPTSIAGNTTLPNL